MQYCYAYQNIPIFGSNLQNLTSEYRILYILHKILDNWTHKRKKREKKKKKKKKKQEKTTTV